PKGCRLCMCMPRPVTMHPRNSRFLRLFAFFLLLSVWAVGQNAPTTAPPPSSTPPAPPPSSRPTQSAPANGQAGKNGAAAQQSGQSPEGENNGVYVFKKQVEEVVLHATV